MLDSVAFRGQIADAHLQQARRTGLAGVVAVCDLEPDLARQAAARFKVPAEYHDVPQPGDPARAPYNLRLCEALVEEHELTGISPVPWTRTYGAPDRS